MNAKKILALVTAASIVAFPTSTVFAQTDLTGGSISTDATVNYVDPTGVINLVVPTSAALNFTLDPQNLAATQGVGTWDPSAGGAILPQAVGTVVNKSAVPVKTEIAFAVTDDSTTPTTLVNTDTDINDGTAKKMYLTVTPANAKVSLTATKLDAITDPEYVQEAGSDKIFAAADLTAAGVAAGDLLASTAAATADFGQFVCVDDAATEKTYKQVEIPVHGDIPATTATTVSEFNGGLASTTNLTPVVTAGANLSYIMDKASYYVTKSASGTYDLNLFSYDYTAGTNTNFDTAAFIIGGSINKNANWSEYTGSTPKKISVAATYSFTSMTDNDAATALASKLTSSHNSVATVAPVTDVAASVTPDSVNYSKTTGATIALNLGSGTGLATSISKIAVTANGTDYDFAAGTYSLSGSNLVIASPSLISTLATGQTRTIKVIFNTGATDTFTANIVN